MPPIGPHGSRTGPHGRESIKGMFGRLLRSKAVARLTWRMARIGLRVTPYYWFEERLHEYTDWDTAEDPELAFGFLQAADIERLVNTEPTEFSAARLGEYLGRLRSGKLFFGARYRDEVVAMMFIDLEVANYLGKSSALARDEAYLGDMFTRRKFRGRNIAPHLRQRAYKALQSMGKTRFYSYSEAFNAPALRFKEKLHAKMLWLGVHVEIFGRYNRHWKLQDYACRDANPGIRVAPR